MNDAKPGGPSAGPRRVLVVEDEVAIAEAVAARLRAEGFEVYLAHDGPSAVTAESELEPDLVVLDVMLPGFDGIEVCRRIQARRPVPVLMVTARDDETDILVGLGVGADDYLTKPFSIRELAARVHALLRTVDRASGRAPDWKPRDPEPRHPAPRHPAPRHPAPRHPAPRHPEPRPARIVVGDIEIDPEERRVHRAGTEVHLTPIEFELLTYLAGRPRAVQPRERLLAQVWGWGGAADGAGPAPGSVATRTVDSHVKALRRKLGTDLIRTVHGVGYALQVPR